MKILDYRVGPLQTAHVRTRLHAAQIALQIIKLKRMHSAQKQNSDPGPARAHSDVRPRTGEAVVEGWHEGSSCTFNLY